MTVRLCSLFLFLQALGAAAWWLVLVIMPAARGPFLPAGFDARVLWSLCAGDLALFIGMGFAASYGVARRRPWAWTALCLHAGAALYAATFALSMSLLTGDAWLGAVLMAPSLMILPPLMVAVRRGGG